MKERTRDLQVLSLLHAGLHRVMLGLGQASWSTSGLCDTSLKKGPSCMKAYGEKKKLPMVIRHSSFNFLSHTGNGKEMIWLAAMRSTRYSGPLFFVLSHGDYCTTGLAFHFHKNPGVWQISMVMKNTGGSLCDRTVMWWQFRRTNAEINPWAKANCTVPSHGLTFRYFSRSLNLR